MSTRRRDLGSSPRGVDPLLVPSHTSDQKHASQAPNRPRTGRSNRRVECPSGDPLRPEHYGELCGRVPVGRRPTGWCRPVRGTLHAQSTHTCAIPLCALTLPTYHEHSWIAFSCTSEPLQSDPLSQLTSPQLPHPARLPRERISAKLALEARASSGAAATPPTHHMLTSIVPVCQCCPRSEIL
jgi:hypothetical protein